MQRFTATSAIESENLPECSIHLSQVDQLAVAVGLDFGDHGKVPQDSATR